MLIGNALANTLQGLAGDDDLQGGLSRDIVNGGLGDDSLDGGLGADRITGGQGSDVIVYRRVDESTPDDADTVWLDRFDRFDLRALDADSALAGQQSFQFIGSQAFSGVAGAIPGEDACNASFNRHRCPFPPAACWSSPPRGCTAGRPGPGSTPGGRCRGR
ncbi:MAG: hypothetical protein ACKN83_05945 [Vulcanococcus sp.]